MSAARPGRRRLDASIPRAYEVATRAPRIASNKRGRFVRGSIVLAWLLSSAIAASSVLAVGAPSWIWRPSAAALLVVFTVALVQRAGGRMRIWATLAVILAGLAVYDERAWLLSAAAVVTAVLASVLAVVATRPTRTILGTLKEFFIALTIAITGTAAVAAWHAPVQVSVFAVSVMVGALALALSIVWSLGSGLHGVGRGAMAIFVVIAVVTAVIFFYSGIVRTHGSPAVTALIDESIIWMRHNIGGVPRPFQALIGFPALIVGVSVRSRYRQGWWVSVLAVVGTMTVVVSLVDASAYPSYFLLSTAYSAVIGIILGLIMRAVVLARTSKRSARAVEQPDRSEPPRFAPLR